jgi:hypothetical protein
MFRQGNCHTDKTEKTNKQKARQLYKWSYQLTDRLTNRTKRGQTDKCSEQEERQTDINKPGITN